MLGTDASSQVMGDVVDTAVHIVPLFQEVVSTPCQEGWVMLKCALPSPRCPKMQGRAPGTSSIAAAVPRTTSSANASIGTETSCLMLKHLHGSALRGSSPECARMRFAWVSDWATVASIASPISIALAIAFSSAARAPELRSEAATSTSTYHAVAVSTGTRVSGTWSKTKSRAKREISSKGGNQFAGRVLYPR